jgi:vancomycin resistance protein VanJ
MGTAPRPTGWMTRLLATAAIGYAAAAVGAALALRLGADSWWPATLLAFGPRWLLGLPGPVLVIAVCVARRWWLLVPVVVAAAASAIVVDVRLPLRRASPGGAPGLAVLTLNAGGGRTPPARLRRLLDEEGIQIAAIQECDFEAADWKDTGWTLERDGHLCLLSRFPVREIDPRDPTDIHAFGGFGAAVRYTVDAPGGPLAIVNLHLATPREGLSAMFHERLGGAGRAALAANTAKRERESALVRAWIDRVTAGRPAIVMGDLNLPIESAIYRRNWSSFANAFSRCGFGLGWSKRTRRFGVRIDHVLLGGGLACETARVGPALGADHRAMIVRVKAPAAR